MAGTFVTFEGGEGTGKSTQLKLLAATLLSRGIPFIQTREPGGTPEAEALRGLLVNGETSRWTAEAEALLNYAARSSHLEKIIRPALAAGKFVLCDRFSDSTRAYQGHGRGVALDLVDQVDHVATADRRPDLTLLFDLPAEVARGRCESKRASGARPEDRLDAEELAFYQRVRTGYLELARAEPNRFRLVHSDGEVAATQAEVRRLLASAVGLPAAAPR